MAKQKVLKKNFEKNPLTRIGFWLQRIKKDSKFKWYLKMSLFFFLWRIRPLFENATKAREVRDEAEDSNVGFVNLGCHLGYGGFCGCGCGCDGVVVTVEVRVAEEVGF